MEPGEPRNKRHDRRGLLAVAGTAIAGIVGAGIGARGAVAADPAPPLDLGSDANVASTPTKLTTTGSAITDDGALVVDGQNADYGIVGSGNSVGVYGKGTIGLFGEGTVGGVFSGTSAAVSLTPLAAAGAPTTPSLKGDVAVDADGILWLCIAEGTPGNWIRVSHGGLRMLGSPQRAYDSRLDVRGIMIGSGPARTIDIVGATDVGGNAIGVPAAALGIACNLTVTQTSDVGFLTAYPTATPIPTSSSLNWAPSWTIANFAVIRLGQGGKVDLYVERSNAHVIVDVVGYIL